MSLGKTYQPLSGPSQPPAPPAYTNPNETKSPYDGGRFQPRNRVNDPIFLVLYVLQVSIHQSVCCNVPQLALQLLGFAALSGIAIDGWIKQGGLGGGIGDGNTGSPITLNWFVYGRPSRLVLIRSSAGQAYRLPVVAGHRRWSITLCGLPHADTCLHPCHNAYHSRAIHCSQHVGDRPF